MLHTKFALPFVLPVAFSCALAPALVIVFASAAHAADSPSSPAATSITASTAEGQSSAGTASASTGVPTPSKAQLVCEERAEMGTPFKICVHVEPAARMNVSFDMAKAFRKLKEINGWMSEWQPGTQLSQVNEAAGAKPVAIGSELFDLLEYALKVSEATSGAFDPTFNAFWGLYNFKPGQEREPTDAEIKERLPLIDWKSVTLDAKNKTAFLQKPGMKLGLGALGQGYGVDAVIAELKKHYASGFVDGSGDTYFWGRKPNGALWTTGIRDPRDKGNVVLRLYGTDFAITTSGDDEKFFMRGDRRVHHIIDPKTGRPSQASRQVTVISRRALDADAYDTGAFVMGPEKGKALLESKGYRGVFVTDKGVVTTKGLKKVTTEWGEAYQVDGELM